MKNEDKRGDIIQNYYEFLIDRALDTKDFEWVKELQQNKNKYKDIKDTQQTNNNDMEYIDRITALEDMISDYGNLTDKGIVNINFQSKDNILNANIIECNKKYKKGEVAKYKTIDEYAQVYIKGYWVGCIESVETDNLASSDYLSYDKGFFDGYKTGENISKIVIENIKNTNEKPVKKWWQLWK